MGIARPGLEPVQRVAHAADAQQLEHAVRRHRAAQTKQLAGLPVTRLDRPRQGARLQLMGALVNDKRFKGTVFVERDNAPGLGIKELRNPAVVLVT